MVTKIENEELGWRGNAPVSPAFDDVYYSAENGLEETNYVFLQGTGAPGSWKQSAHFVIGETGFGTGLNFLATWKAFMESGANGRLTFISLEAYPLTETALRRAHATFPVLRPYSDKLCDAWPPAAPGFHARSFEGGRIRLILMFGEASSVLPRLSASVDAWYLDGFAPAKNPGMWSDDILDQIARLSKPGTRFATFTAAGFVKRALRARGFAVDKVPGYGRKRERLVGVAENPAPLSVGQTTISPEWASLSSVVPGPIAVIGAGIAGASIAHALKQRGHDVLIVSAADKPCASHVPSAILSPRFLPSGQPMAGFLTSAYAYACAFEGYAGCWAETAGIEFLPQGADDQNRLLALIAQLGWSEDWLKPTSEGFKLVRGGSLDNRAALAALTSDIPFHNKVVTTLEPGANSWRIKTEDGTATEAAHVILAGGILSPSLLPQGACPPLRPNKGQVELIADQHLTGVPSHSLSYGGYLTASIGGIRTLGSTFDRLEDFDGHELAFDPGDRRRICAQFQAVTGRSVPQDCPTGSWAGMRATVYDHMPYVGPVFDMKKARMQYADLARDAKITGLGAAPAVPGLSMLMGLGSKGYQYGPILADYLAATLSGDPLPLPTSHIAALHPLRAFIRALVRGKS